jgi:hypothetical protein
MYFLLKSELFLYSISIFAARYPANLILESFLCT